MELPEALAVDIAEQRNWLNAHRAERGLSYEDLAKLTGIKGGTIGAFAIDKYAGNNQRIADAVYSFRQRLVAQATMAMEVPAVPSYFETPSSRRMTARLTFAQIRGRISVVATVPGLGKTTSCENYASADPLVYLATMSPTSEGILTMLIAILDAMGERDAKGTPQALSRRIKERMRSSPGGLLIVDEAHNLSEKALDELRTLNDATGFGLCLAGNQDVLLRLKTGSRRAALAQLESRVGNYMIAYGPEPGDAQALASAWNVSDAAQVAYLEKIAAMPGTLRTCTYVLETAAMMAASAESPISLALLREAWSSRSNVKLEA
ncbi:hypothetical protein DBR17_17895 [Sphingomonas sp. HMWF008]|nr:hypothetical protein DBR17_17895 [Sphingomonas sp. HMWF008]